MSQETGNKRRNPVFDRRRIHRQCARKKGYTTSKDANRQIQKTFKATGIKLAYYQCEYCGKYHLTKHFVKNRF